MLELIATEVAAGLISFEMKANLKKEFDEELRTVKGMMNESYNSFLIPMINDISKAVARLLNAEK